MKLGLGANLISKSIKVFNGFYLYVTKTGLGTITPDIGIYGITPNDEVTVTASETDPDYYLDAIYDDAVAVANPYIFTMAANKAVEARFLAWIKIMDVFSTAPVLVGSDWVFEGGLNDIIIDTNQVASFNIAAANPSLDLVDILNINHTANFFFEAEFYPTGTVIPILECIIGGRGSDFNFSSRRYLTPIFNKTAFFIKTTAGTEAWYWDLLARNQWHRIRVDVVGTALTVTLNGTVYNYTMNGTFAPAYNQIAYGGNRNMAGAISTNEGFQGYIRYINFNDKFVTYNECGINVGANIPSITSNDYYGVADVSSLATFWGTKLNGLEPIPYTDGCSFYKTPTGEPFPLMYYNGLPTNNTNVTLNLTKLGDFPANSGISEYLPNVYSIPFDPDLNLIIPKGDYTFAQLMALVPSDYLQLTKSELAAPDDTIEKLLVRIKASLDYVSVFDGIYKNSILLPDSKVSASSVYEFQYSGNSLSVQVASDVSIAGYKYVSIFVDGVFYQKLDYVDSTYFDLSLPIGNKTVKILTGITTKPSATVLNTRITDIMAHSSLYTKINTISTDKIVVIADSIGVGDAASNYNYTAWATKFMYIDNIDTSLLGWGYGKIKDSAETTPKIEDTIAKLTSAFNNSGRKIVIIQAGTNDYGLDSTAAATFGTWYLALVQAIKSIGLGIEIYCYSPLHRDGETSLLTDYRTQIVGICTNEAVTHIDGFAIMNYSVTNYANAVHPNDAGMLLIYNYIKSALTI